MTKVRDLTRQQGEEKKLKPIDFILSCSDTDDWNSSVSAPSQWDNIDLICKNWRNSGFDLMRIYNNDSDGFLILGHFNDGYV